jgi:hypothetical protein
MEGAVFEESEGPIEDILGGRKDDMLYIRRSDGMTSALETIFNYLIILMAGRVRLEFDGGRPGTAV